ncbi:MAG: GNAT family N-acetyltransferase [Prevotella sp.]|nr:GNAT family N-acetyltransferase [Prevotella sp.]MBQ6210041.1 GNAT family N-acetyltransferase [Prevotella sp.]
MKLVRLTSDYEISDFDCGDDDLNKFLFDDAKSSQELRIANTFILEDNGQIVAYFCLLNDKVSKDEIIGSKWKKIKNSFPKGKQFSSYPTIKIGRYAVSIHYHGRNIGSDLMSMVKKLLNAKNVHSAFRYITVDAYLSAIPFYEKNGFVHLKKRDENEHTRLMFYDMMEVG